MNGDPRTRDEHDLVLYLAMAMAMGIGMEMEMEMEIGTGDEVLAGKVDASIMTKMNTMDGYGEDWMR